MLQCSRGLNHSYIAGNVNSLWWQLTFFPPSGYYYFLFLSYYKDKSKTLNVHNKFKVMCYVICIQYRPTTEYRYPLNLTQPLARGLPLCSGFTLIYCMLMPMSQNLINLFYFVVVLPQTIIKMDSNHIADEPNKVADVYRNYRPIVVPFVVEKRLDFMDISAGMICR